MALQPKPVSVLNEVTAQIGVDGMGEVYRATDTSLAHQVAIVWRRSILGRVSPPDSNSSRGPCLSKSLARPFGISIATAQRDWQAARAWLLKELRGERAHDA